MAGTSVTGWMSGAWSRVWGRLYSVLSRMGMSTRGRAKKSVSVRYAPQLRNFCVSEGSGTRPWTKPSASGCKAAWRGLVVGVARIAQVLWLARVSSSGCWYRSSPFRTRKRPCKRSLAACREPPVPFKGSWVAYRTGMPWKAFPTKDWICSPSQPVTIIISVMFLGSRRREWRMSGVPQTGMSALGCCSVNGRSLSSSPAARMTACIYDKKKCFTSFGRSSLEVSPFASRSISSCGVSQRPSVKSSGLYAGSVSKCIL